MKLDLINTAAQEYPHFKGGEGTLLAKMYSDGMNRILNAVLVPGVTIGYHKHETNSEIVYILSGTATCIMDDGEEEILPAGTCHYCPKGHSHSLRNFGTENVEIIAVVPEQ